MKSFYSLLIVAFILGIFSISLIKSETKTGDGKTVEDNINTGKTGSKTDDETVKKEEEAIKLDGLNVAQMKELRDKAEKHVFQAEVDRMMKLIINSLYKNKEIFLRELISNASDALDKIRFLSLTDTSALAATSDLTIRIKANKEGKSLHITDTGIGMTKDDLVKNLGTIAKSGTAEFMKRMGDAKSSTEMSDLIGQFGVGFYSSFLVADKVTVITKHNDDDQYIWESDAASYSVIKDPRGNTLKRGTEIILHLKEDNSEYLEHSALQDLVSKYSQFINFPIYVWSSKTVSVPAEESGKTDDAATKKAEDEKTKTDDKKKDEDATVEEEKEKEKKTDKKTVEKTVWDWVLVNENKPIWTRKPADVSDNEYDNFYKAFSKESEGPLSKIHFTAEGEVTFKSILFIPKRAPHDMFRNIHQNVDNIKLYVRRVFITDQFKDMMPGYLSFVKGVVDSDDLPLNVSREHLQQSKLLKVIKKKLVRKTLDMIKKMNEKDFEAFWKEFGTNLKIGVTEDHSNRTRLAKLLRFWSSFSDEKMTTLSDYVSRMKEKQKSIFFIAGDTKEALKNSPLVERILKKGYEVLYCVDPIDEYAMNALPDFDGKKFQNLAKEGVQIDDETAKAKEKKELIAKDHAALMEYLKNDALKDQIEKVEISDRLTESPCALVATTWGYSGNMQKIMMAQAYRKSNDPQHAHMLTQKRILEINPRHPLVKELKARVSDERKTEPTTRSMAVILFETATLRSGYVLQDMTGFASRVEHMMRLGMKIPLDEKVEQDEDDETVASPPVSDKTVKLEDSKTGDKSTSEEKKDGSGSTTKTESEPKTEL